MERENNSIKKKQQQQRKQITKEKYVTAFQFFVAERVMEAEEIKKKDGNNSV